VKEKFVDLHLHHAHNVTDYFWSQGLLWIISRIIISEQLKKMLQRLSD